MKLATAPRGTSSEPGANLGERGIWEMSKSKEGVDKREDAEMSRRDDQSSEIDQRLGAMGQTDYTGGRESSPEFPRRSTARRIAINDAEDVRNGDWESPRHFEREYRRGQSSRIDQERSSYR